MIIFRMFYMKEIISTIYIAAAVQGFLLAPALALRKKNSNSTKFLALAILVWTFILLEQFLSIKGLNTVIPHTTSGTFLFKLIFWPLLYFYTATITSNIKKLNKLKLLHFLPVILYAAYMLPFYTKSNSEKIKIVEIIAEKGVPLNLAVAYFAVFIIGWVYLFIMLKILVNYSKNIKSLFSDISRKNLIWLQILIAVLVSVWSIETVRFIYDLTGTGMNDTMMIFIHFLTTIWIYVTSYFALHQPEIFDSYIKFSDSDNLKMESSIKNQAKYEKSGLTNEMIETYYKKLSKYMEIEKPYLTSSITLKQLAEEMDMMPHHLSQVINSRDKNFYTFINSYRIEQVKEMLISNEMKEKNILEICYDAGFKSQSSFNTIFKKFTGKTPTQYRIKNSE